ncbi:recombinase family protein [Bombella apis]|uniref:recombinase RecT n=1 Tax=Bombella apis TaxID=1785988 RepID=UPI00187B899F|nr:recombinase RecT [Bombella apis]
MSNEIVTTQGQSTPSIYASPLQPRNFGELMEFAKIAAGSGMVPRDYAGKPQAVVIACQMGAELGLAPMQSLQNIAVINGRPSVWGDALLALVRSSPICDDVVEVIEGSGDNRVAICTATRKGKKPVVGRFSVKDAQNAGLWTKPGPWKQYPERMLQMRARGFALRDAFPDVLRGLITAEEAQDMAIEAPFNPKPDADPRQSKKKAAANVSLDERARESADRFVADVKAASSEDDLEKITGGDKAVKLRNYLREKLPDLAVDVDKVVQEKLASFEVERTKEQPKPAKKAEAPDDLEVPPWV